MAAPLTRSDFTPVSGADARLVIEHLLFHNGSGGVVSSSRCTAAKSKAKPPTAAVRSGEPVDSPQRSDEEVNSP